MRKAFDVSVGYIDPDFCRWAFGVEADSPIFRDAMQLLDLWNYRHGDELILDPDGKIEFDMDRMGIIWAYKGYPDRREMVS